MKDGIEKIKESFLLFARGLRERSTGALEAELKELENAFALVLLGALTGMPAPPSYLGIKLLPYLEREIRIMICRSESLNDIFADWFDILDFG